MKKIKWGILSTAKIGIEKVIPAMRQARNGTVAGIASRSGAKARQAADKLQIPSFYDSYEGLLADPGIDAIYNPLPNHLHVPWTIKSLEAGKHVLCEKPIALDSNEAKSLLKAANQHPDLRVMEAFMYRFHPQWQKTRALVEDGSVGQLKTVESFFSYFNDDPENIRNIAKMGGGGLMDIGCYCISLARFLFSEEPERIAGHWKIDPDFNTDYLASGTMEFTTGTATFTCGTRIAANQRVNVVGTEGRVVIEIPFNAPPDKPTRIWLYTEGNKKEIAFPPVDQYTLQAEQFADAILQNKAVPTPLNDALHNMKVMDAFRASARRNGQDKS